MHGPKQAGTMMVGLVGLFGSSSGRQTSAPKGSTLQFSACAVCSGEKTRTSNKTPPLRITTLFNQIASDGDMAGH